jgi:hypothetical protein
MAAIDPADLIQYTFVEEETTTSTNNVTTPNQSVTLPDGSSFDIPGTSYPEQTTSTTEVFKAGFINRNYVTNIKVAGNPTRTTIALSDGSSVTVTTIFTTVLSDLTT